MNYNDMFTAVERNQGYIIDILQRIIAVDTTIPPGNNYDKLIDVVEPELRRYGFTTERVSVPPDKISQIPWELTGERVNLVGRLANGKPRASVYAHMDVVPVDENWTRDPFGGEVENGKLYGRGTVDMKGSIACFLGALKTLSDLGIEPLFALDCMLCTDEEIGVYPGARYLAEQGYFSPHLIWLEFGVIDFPAIVIGSSGALRMEIIGTGKSAHSGSNFLGVNAIEEMVPVLDELMALKREVEQRISRVPTFPMPGMPSDKMTPMFNLNIIRGGSGVNVVADECRISLDRRYIPDESYADVLGEIEAALERGRARSKLLDLRWNTAHSYPPMELDRNSVAIEHLLQIKKAVHGWDEFIYGGVSMSTDMGFVIDALKPEKVMVAPFGVDRGMEIRAHTTDEFVYIDDLIGMTKELAAYIST